MDGSVWASIAVGADGVCQTVINQLLVVFFVGVDVKWPGKIILEYPVAAALVQRTIAVDFSRDSLRRRFANDTANFVPNLGLARRRPDAQGQDRSTGGRTG